MFCSGRKWVAEATICTKLMKREKRRMGKRRAKKAKREKKKRRERRRNEKRGNQMKRMYERKKYETDLEDQDIMGAFLDKPKMEKHNAQGQGNGLRYGLSSMQGKSRQHECDFDLFSKCTQSITRSSEEGGRVGQVPGMQSRRNHKEAGGRRPRLSPCDAHISE
ncbi:PPM1A isoform 3 [Pongo abelii]|uniref:PPM1A isoform 3 n=1 Tax=Pongo abelii TaxID=9601 RepID=A0A2J8WLH5_PONAB|nr:PPM1A isoform 3 [Pongo abelii]